jgi:hypothetical protein
VHAAAFGLTGMMSSRQDDESDDKRSEVTAPYAGMPNGRRGQSTRQDAQKPISFVGLRG